jgi:hypothetical protein
MSDARTCTTTWRDLVRHLAVTGDTMIVRGRFDGLDADLEWVANAAGLKLLPGGSSWVIWYPNPGNVLTTSVPVPGVHSGDRP